MHSFQECNSQHTKHRAALPDPRPVRTGEHITVSPQGPLAAALSLKTQTGRKSTSQRVSQEVRQDQLGVGGGGETEGPRVEGTLSG